MNAKSQTIEKTALLVSIASIMQIAESFFPHPIPGIRLGLANMITLIALVRLGPRCAIEIAVLRTVISSIILGTFLSPTFIMSFLAALGSTILMILFSKMMELGGKKYFSIISTSLVGAASHNLIQILVAYLMIIRHKSVFLLMPWLGISAVLTGWITGMIAMHVCRKLETADQSGVIGSVATSEQPTAVDLLANCSPYTDVNSPLHAISPALKIIALLMLTVLVLFASSFVVFGVILAVLLGTGLMARTSPLSMIFALRKQLSLILLSFLMPVLFHTTGSILWIIGPVTVTSDGLLMGVMFASRLVLLMIASSLLVRTTKPVDLAGGFETILAPMDTFGLNSKRISSIMSLSLTSMPAIWNSARALLNRRRQGNPADRRLIPDLINFIAEMYRQAEIKEKNA